MTMQEKICAAAARICDKVEVELAAARLNLRHFLTTFNENGATPAELAGALSAIGATIGRLERVYGENLGKWEQLHGVLDPGQVAEALHEAPEGTRLVRLPDKQTLVLEELNDLRRQLLDIAAVLP